MLLAHERAEYFFAYDLFEKGVMPETGGWTQQAAHWIEAFRVIRGVVAQVRAEQLAAMKEPV